MSRKSGTGGICYSTNDAQRQEGLRSRLEIPRRKRCAKTPEMPQALLLPDNLILAGGNGDCVQIIDGFRGNAELLILLLLGRKLEFIGHSHERLRIHLRIVDGYGEFQIIAVDARVALLHVHSDAMRISLPA